MLRERGRGGRCVEKDKGAHREKGSARPPEREVRPQKAVHPIFWNHFQKCTDLSASPGMCRTLPETSVQLCTPGWSKVPGEKMLSGTILGSMLGKKRQTHNRESQGGWMQVNHCLLGSVVISPAKGHTQGFLMGRLREEGQYPFWGGSSMWPTNCSHQPSL